MVEEKLIRFPPPPDGTAPGDLLVTTRKIFSFREFNEVSFEFPDGAGPTAEDEALAERLLREAGVAPGRKLLKELAARIAAARGWGPRAGGLLLEAVPTAVEDWPFWEVRAPYLLGRAAAYLAAGLAAAVYNRRYGFRESPAAFDDRFLVPPEPDPLPTLRARAEAAGGGLRAAGRPDPARAAAALEAVAEAVAEAIRNLRAAPPSKVPDRWREVVAGLEALREADAAAGDLEVARAWDPAGAVLLEAARRRIAALREAAAAAREETVDRLARPEAHPGEGRAGGRVVRAGPFRLWEGPDGTLAPLHEGEVPPEVLREEAAVLEALAAAYRAAAGDRPLPSSSYRGGVVE